MTERCVPATEHGCRQPHTGAAATHNISYLIEDADENGNHVATNLLGSGGRCLVRSARGRQDFGQRRIRGSLGKKCNSTLPHSGYHGCHPDVGDIRDRRRGVHRRCLDRTGAHTLARTTTGEVRLQSGVCKPFIKSTKVSYNLNWYGRIGCYLKA